MIAVTLASFEANLARFGNIWKARLLASTVMPVLYLVVFGSALGTFLPARPPGDLSYHTYVGSGLVVFFAAQVGAVETGMPLFSDLNWHRNLHAVRYTPATAASILAGHLVYLALRVLQVSTVLLVAMFAYDRGLSPAAVGMLAVAVVCGTVMACVVGFFAASATSSFQIETVQRLLPIAALVTSGVLFPIGRLPGALRWAAEANPFYHGVQLSRALLGVPTGAVLPHLAVIAGWLTVGFLATRARLGRKLRHG